ncbi:TPA: hypothetical protein ACG6LW_001325 [Streptococcus agalactiae]
MLNSSFHFNNLSGKPKKGPITISTRNLVFDSIETNKIIAPRVEAKVEYFDFATTCYNLPDLEFSNCYPLSIEEGATPPHIISAFNAINEDANIIKTNIKHIRHDGINEERIEKILKKYLGADFDIYRGLFYKSDIITGPLLSDRGKFRVISLYIVEPKTHKQQRHSKHKLIILFFDPYHLFIPSKDFGTNIYQEIRGYSSMYCNFLA